MILSFLVLNVQKSGKDLIFGLYYIILYHVYIYIYIYIKKAVDYIY